MELVKTEKYDELKLTDGQAEQVSGSQSIQNALQRDDCIGFYAVEENIRVGFALLRRFEPGCFFLWDFIIDRDHQGRGKGRKFLNLLIDHMRNAYSAAEMTTTYIYGNETAKNLYESVGFVTTDIVDEDGIHEINMAMRLE